MLFSESIRTHCVQRPWQPSQKCRWWDKDAGLPPNIFFCHSYCHRRGQNSFVKGSSQLSFQGSPDCVFIRQEPLQVQARASTPSARITTARTPPDFSLVQDYPHCLRVETLSVRGWRRCAHPTHHSETVLTWGPLRADAPDNLQDNTSVGNSIKNHQSESRNGKQ